MTDIRERIAELARLRQRICEEILTYGESKREGPDLALTLDRIFAAFEIAGYTRPAQPAEELTPKPGMAMPGCNDAHGFTGTPD